MEEEASSAPGTYRNSMMSKIRSYRRDFDKLRKDLVRLEVFLHLFPTESGSLSDRINKEMVMLKKEQKGKPLAN